MVAPKLRFKEFDEDWNFQLLGNMAEFVSGYAFDSEKFGESGRKLITPKNFTIFGRALFTQQNTKYTTESCDEKFVCRGNDLLVLLTDLTQSCELLGKPVLLDHMDEEILLNQRILKIQPNEDVVSKSFLLNFFLTENYLKHIKETSTGTTVRHSSNKILSKQTIFYPSLEEQTKIASFLSALDEKISQLTQKHQLLSQYKQGMMQKLFSQQIRFKADDGSEFGEWEETILSDIVNLFHGYQFRTSDFTSKGIAVIKIGNVIGNNLDLANLTYINENRLEDFKKFEILNGDILMSLTGNIGRIIEVKNKPFIILQNYRVGKFIPLNENFLIKPFLKYLLTSDLVFGRFSQLANQSAQANFGKQDMDKIAVFYPSVSEQTKIANFLSSIDQKIDVVSEQLEQAKLWKKGLLQQMFV